MTTPLLRNEAERLEALRQLKILDTAPEQPYDDLTFLAAHICETPIALTTLIDMDRQWFKAKVGLPLAETSRNISFCAHAILQPDLFIVRDALSDDRFATNPLVTADPKIRFYAGVPLVTSEGFALGTLCVIDRVPRELRPDQEAALRALARQVLILLQLRKANADLASLTREVHVTNARLQAAMQQIAEASRHKSEFLANMSHELRTPLNSIIGFSELLLERGVGPLTEKQARFLNHIGNGGKHLLQLINDILDLSKVEAGKLSLQPEPVPVASTLEDILVLAQGLANKKAQTVEAEIAPDLPPLQADPVRLKQILLNLLSNAVKFTPERGRITLVARPASPDGKFLEIRVTDTGPGIRPEDLSRLFQEFVQLGSTQAQRHEGTGLGLALTKRLVEMHGGRIGADSAGTGHGSAFTVLLPFAGPGGPAEVSAVAPREAHSALPSRAEVSPGEARREPPGLHGILPFDRRVERRARLPVWVTVLTEAVGAPTEPDHGEAENLSRTGMLLRVPKRIEPATSVRVTILLKQRPPLPLEGTVVWVQPHPHLTGWALGVRLNDKLPGDLVADIAEAHFPLPLLTSERQD